MDCVSASQRLDQESGIFSYNPANSLPLIHLCKREGRQRGGLTANDVRFVPKADIISGNVRPIGHPSWAATRA
jgi:hypothetical protein